MRRINAQDMRKIARYQVWLGTLRKDTAMVAIQPEYFQVSAQEIEFLAPLAEWKLECRHGKDLHIRLRLNSTNTKYICCVVDAGDGEIYQRLVEQMEGK